jgi:hypothetical protein
MMRKGKQITQTVNFKVYIVTTFDAPPIMYERFKA